VSPATRELVACITHHDVFRLGEVNGRKGLGGHLLRGPADAPPEVVLGGLAQVARLDGRSKRLGAFEQRFGGLDAIELVDRLGVRGHCDVYVTDWGDLANPKKKKKKKKGRK
jgi:hypothetical protein